MIKEDILFFEKKNVKLVKNDGFILYGKIIKINDDNIFFKTNQTSSVISISGIKEITARGIQ